MSTAADSRPRASSLWAPGRLAAPDWLIAFPAILVWTALANLPSFGYDDADDAFFLEIAHLWTRGHPPFVAAFDVKGLGFFALLALAVKVFGATLTTLKIVGIVSSAIAATLLHQLCAKWDRPAAAVCAAIFPVLLIISGDVAYQVLSVFLLLAFLSAFSDLPVRTKALAAGLALGYACAIKQTCAIDGVALLYILCVGEKNRAEWPGMFGRFIASAAAAPTVFLLYYLARGDVAILLHDLVFSALSRGGIFPWAEVPYWFVNWLLPLAVVAAAALIALAHWSDMQARLPVKTLAAWMALELLGIVAQRAGNQFGFIPLIPPMLLLGATYVSARFRAMGEARRRLGLAAFGVLALGQAFMMDGKSLTHKMWRIDETALGQAVTAIADTHPAREDRLFVLNGPAWPNLALDLAPPTPYIHYAHVMCDFPDAGLPALIANFDAAPRYIVVENPRLRIGCETNPYVNVIQSRLDADYKTISLARGERVTYQVYERSR
jgi:hypothetical protein